jgi:Tfp pilus assembly protein PilF
MTHTINNSFKPTNSIDDNKAAEKLIKKAIKKNDDRSDYLIDLGCLYLQQTDTNKANKQFNKAIDNLKANNSDIYLCANYFMQKTFYDYACKTYLKGRELFKDKTKYTYELSYIYQIEGKDEDIAKEYLVLLESNPDYLSQIEVNLNNLFERDKNDKLVLSINNIVLEKVKENPNNNSFNELYLWLLMQKNDYQGAFNQAKAIDKRFNKGDGGIVFEFAENSLNSKQYNIAEKAFSYIVEKGKDNMYYEKSRIDKVACLYLPFMDKPNNDKKEIDKLKNEFSSSLKDLGQTSNTVELMQNYAYLLAYHLNEAQEAVDILDSTINMRQVSMNDKAKSKLMRADIFLFQGDIWQASLTYSQVEKDMKNDVLGSQAKFRNAMLSYYTGDFAWAFSQFDALRASTTKLIANDAMEYSLLIKENMDEDSSYKGLTLFAKADFCIYQNQLDKAKLYLDTINQTYLSHPLFDEVLYKRAEIAMKENKYLEADSLLGELITKYPYDITADDAVFMLAKINEENFHNNKKALEYYQKLIIDYPSSLYVNEARRKYNELNKQQN